MAKFWLQGVLLGLAYLAPIGMQNLYVINTAAQGDRRRTAVVVASTIFFDISLALACFFGVGVLIESSLHIRRLILLAGSFVVTGMGFSLLRSALRHLSKEEQLGLSRGLARWTAISDSRPTPARLATWSFAVTWLNPQAIIDGSFLLGGTRAALPPGASAGFIAGVCLASATWFTLLAVSVSALRAHLSLTTVRAISGLCGAVLVIYGIRLGIALLT